ncbi:WW domain binding protein 1-like [Haliotis cracherodii]|uniref:WW domain binding protein 1-like n=1 Tax=Haliotis cracherodii TaxID=6455 RepID=UPI0039EC22D7
MSVSKGLLSSLLSVSLFETTWCYAQCGSTFCTEYSAYCCAFDTTSCCYHSVYSFWWFWFIWVIIFLVFTCCSVCCYRRRRYQPAYVMVPDHHQPAYGTVSVSVAPPPYPAVQHQAATAPPPYQPEQKPPAYAP